MDGERRHNKGCNCKRSGYYCKIILFVEVKPVKGDFTKRRQNIVFKGFTNI
jgi:hypothetical protein